MKKLCPFFTALTVVILILCLSTASAKSAEDEYSGNNPFAAQDADRGESLAAIQESEDSQSILNTPFSPERNQSAAINNSMSAENRYIVTFKQDASLQQIFVIVKDYKYILLGKSELRLFAMELRDPSDFENKAMDIVKSIEKDTTCATEAVPSDQYYSSQWALTAMNLPQAWDINKGSNSVYVAVIDSGVKRSHIDLQGADIRNGYDFRTGTACDWDATGHGTFVTGIIGASTNNGIGVAGVAWNAAIIPLKVINSDGKGYVSDIINAIIDAADIGCKVINLSLGGNTYIDAEATAVAYAVSKGSMVIAAAGNDGTGAYSYPASYNGVISVGAITPYQTVAYFSQHNDRVDLVAPGVSIVSTSYNATTGAIGFDNEDGTSFAAPQVAGIAALAFACKPNISVSELTNALFSTCNDLGTPGYDNYYGFGMVDANNLLCSLQPLTGFFTRNEGTIYYKNGNPAVGWLEINGYIYHFDSSGAMDMGWKQMDGYTLYFTDQGRLVKGWKEIDSKIYYFNEYGRRLSGWQLIDGYVYYFDGSGCLVKGWRDISGHIHYFDEYGRLLYNWQLIDGYIYYFDENGYLVKGWRQINGYIHYFNEYGRLLYGWQLIGGYVYYFNESAYLVKGWREVEGHIHYFNDYGRQLYGWQLLNGHVYYFDESGYMVKGWRTMNGHTFYFNENGQLLYNWQLINGSVYFFDESGYMVKGWRTMNGHTFYFNEIGQLLYGLHSINGINYRFDENGYLITASPAIGN